MVAIALTRAATKGFYECIHIREYLFIFHLFAFHCDIQYIRINIVYIIHIYISRERERSIHSNITITRTFTRRKRKR